jgi:quercetin dioxygenase-like cupin family protein
MAIVEGLRFAPMTDPGDPDDWRPNSEWSLVIDPGGPAGKVRELSMIFEHIAPGDAIPLHSHPTDEAIVVDAGTLEVRLGEERRTVEAGAVVFIPRGTQHGSRNVGAELARIHGIFPTEVLTIEYLERNPAPGTEADPPRPPWWVDLRAVGEEGASGPVPAPN